MHRRPVPAVALLAALVVAWSVLAVPPAVASHAPGHREAPLATAIHPATSGMIADEVTLWANGSATSTVHFDVPVHRITFEARATWCDGPARLEVRVDGQLLMGRPIAADEGRYALVGEWAPGAHHLSFRFTNDRLTDTCDRNLHLGRSVAFLGPDDGGAVHVATTSLLRTATVTPLTAGRLTPNTGGYAQYGAELWGAGTIRLELDAQGGGLLLRGAVVACDGYPSVEIRVDGRVIHSGRMSPFENGYGWLIGGVFLHSNVRLLHTVEFELLDPHRGDGCQRRLRLQSVTFTDYI